jgi:hypothetical protein
MEEEARSTSQAQEKKDEGSLVSTLNAIISFLDSNNRTANKRLAPQSQHPPPQF